MIEAESARSLTAQLLEVEERIQRLLTSGWRQAHSETAEFRRLAGGLAEAGLPNVAKQVAAVADASDVASGLRALALAESACRLLRLRLPTTEIPADWQAAGTPRGRKGTAQDTVTPLARLQVDGREVWACSWGARYQMVVLEPPLPEPIQEPAEPAAASGFLGRLKQRLTSQPPAEAPGSVWLHKQLRGSITWAGRYPVAANGEVALCTMEDAEWIDKADTSEAAQLQQFRMTLAVDNLKQERPAVWWNSGLQIVPSSAKELSAATWIDPSVAAAFQACRDSGAWVLTWSGPAREFLAPLAWLQPGRLNQVARIVHLLPGLPSNPISPLP